jgi:mutator protein MutT
MRLLTTCGAILFNSEGKVLVLRRSKTDERRPLQWDLPGGHAEPGEEFEDALRREVHEETGQSIGTSDVRLIYETSGTFPDVRVNWLFFIAQSPSAEVTLSSEHDDFRWVPIDDAIRMVEYSPKHEALVHARDNGLLHV